LYSLPNISRITRRTIRCAGHVARVGEKINAFRLLKERYNFEELGAVEGTILKWTLRIGMGR